MCDSSVGLPPELIEQRGLCAAPVGHSLGFHTYKQGDQTHAKFFDALANGEMLIINGVSSDSREAAYRVAIQEHDDGILCLCQSFGSNSPSFDYSEHAARRMRRFADI